VPAGGNYKIIISDGTEIWLNAASRLRFPLRFAATIREVFLDGEAYFKVAADARRPFIVHTPLTRVNVLGTAFNINTYEPGNVRTALVDGKVITEGDDGKSLVLSPGYAADYRAAQGFSSEKFEREDELAWINGVYYFHDMPIGDLARMASRCYGINIVLDKTKFAGRSLTGLLDRNKLSEFLNDLEVTAHIKYYYSGNDLYLE
jgi:ferric-dicitrate binding protein FerR (iron transport regulator)